MARYHVNPQTGNPGICKATQSCPFGDLTKDHFPSREKASRSYETRMKLREELSSVRCQVQDNANRVAQQGNWPDYINPQASLTGRIPKHGTTAPGFDAGVACALNLIPPDKQTVSSVLHAAYTPEMVNRVRAEITNLQADDESCWWLAGCSVCREGVVTEQEFSQQLQEFSKLANSPGLRVKTAQRELNEMRQRYSVREGVAFAHEDGGMQAAYLDGHQVSAMYAPNTDLYFLGTYQETLGLESFDWSSEVDSEGRARSGPVHGSKQFVKAANLEEYQRAIAAMGTQQ
jgi:hypothetical protein